jgi:hypothetical protein
MAVGLPSASAHMHPTPKDLTGPGVVYIEAGYHVDIALIEHGIRTSHINLIQRIYDPVLLRGSGFAVDPSAVVVTDGEMARPDPQAAKNYAVNKIFQATYGDFRMPADPYAQIPIDPGVGTSPDDYTEINRLRGCYEERTNTAGGCVITITKKITVYPFVTNQDLYGRLDATVLTPGSSADITLLRVSAGSMPTVNLAVSTAGVYHLGVLGFNGIPDKNHQITDYKAHLDKVGGTRFKAGVDDNKVFNLITPQVLANGLQGAPVAAELGQVIGFIAPPPPTASQGTSPTLIRTGAVLAALDKQHVTPLRGPGDGNYESAMHKFQNQGYAASIPGFQNALAVYPGHFLAAQNLAIARTQVAKGAPGSSSSTIGAPAVATTHKSWPARWWPLLVAVAVVLIGSVVFVALWLRRRRGALAAAATGADPRAPQSQRSPPSKPATMARPSGSNPGADRSPGAVRGPGARSAGTGSNRDGPLQSRTGREPVAAGAGGPRAEGNPRGGSSMMSRAAGGTSSAPLFCTGCGGRLASHHRYCGWCGAPVD